nr:hypothetical protein CFP56_50968 [Quercus suber]
MHVVNHQSFGVEYRSNLNHKDILIESTLLSSTRRDADPNGLQAVGRAVYLELQPQLRILWGSAAGTADVPIFLRSIMVLPSYKCAFKDCEIQVIPRRQACQTMIVKRSNAVVDLVINRCNGQTNVSHLSLAKYTRLYSSTSKESCVPELDRKNGTRH